jgi:hypothetical protein
MGMFAKRANVDYRLFFANQGKQTSVFRLQKTNGSLPYPFSAGFVFRIYEAQAIFFNPFTVCSSCKRKFVVCPFFYTEEQTQTQTD